MRKIEKSGNDEQYNLLLRQISELVKGAKRRVANSISDFYLAKYVIYF
jgi:hypothetical protein